MAATLDARLRLDSSQFDGGLNRALRESNTFVSKISAQFGSLRNILGAGAAGAFVIGYGREAIDAAAKMESLEKQLAAVSGGAFAAAKEMERLRQVALMPGLDLDSAVSGTVRMRLMGFTSDEAAKHLESLANVIATFGGSGAELNGVITALSQISSKGVISAEEINQIAERMPTIRNDMQAAFGTSNTEALQKMNISAKEFVETLMNQWSKVPPVVAGIKEEVKQLGMELNRWLSGAGRLAAPIVGVATDSISAVRQQWQWEVEAWRDMLDFTGNYARDKEVKSFLADMEKYQADMQVKRKNKVDEEKRATDELTKQRDLMAEMANIQGNEAASQQEFNDALRSTAEKVQSILGDKFKDRAGNLQQQQIDAIGQGIGPRQLTDQDRELIEAAAAESDRLAESMGQGIGPQQMSDDERDMWREQVARQGMGRSERKSERRANRELDENIRKTADRKTREQMREIKDEQRKKAFDDLKQNKFFNEEATKKNLKDLNRKSAEEAVKKSAATLTDIRDILKTLATA